MNCPTCGAPNSPSAPFCGFCGLALAPQPAAPPRPPPPDRPPPDVDKDADEDVDDELPGRGRRRERLRPHRGGGVLALGILGLVCCLPCGIIAILMANSDLLAMREGRMDRAGEGLTVAGRTCAIVGVALLALGLLVQLLNPHAFHSVRVRH